MNTLYPNQLFVVVLLLSSSLTSCTGPEVSSASRPELSNKIYYFHQDGLRKVISFGAADDGVMKIGPAAMPFTYNFAGSTIRFNLEIPIAKTSGGGFSATKKRTSAGTLEYQLTVEDEVISLVALDQTKERFILHPSNEFIEFYQGHPVLEINIPESQDTCRLAWSEGDAFFFLGKPRDAWRQIYEDSVYVADSIRILSDRGRLEHDLGINLMQQLVGKTEGVPKVVFVADGVISLAYAQEVQKVLSNSLGSTSLSYFLLIKQGQIGCLFPFKLSNVDLTGKTASDWVN